MIKSTKHEHTFWVGYSDFMTSMFFISLVLFVIFYINNQKKIKEVNQRKKQVEYRDSIMRNIENDMKELESSRELKYNTKYRRFELKRQIKFSYADHRIKNSDDIGYLLSVGKEIFNMIQKLTMKYKNSQYMLIIEGMASKDGYKLNDQLSYNRALEVYKIWYDNDDLREKIDRHNRELTCKIQIVGSGEDKRGWGRLNSNIRPEDDQKIIVYLTPYISYNEFFNDKK